MIVKGFGIQLTRIRHEHIEIVRENRNSKKISQYMEFQNEITPQMQEEWFQSINNKFNNYFLIEFNGAQVGMIYGAEVDWEKKETGNGGIFIWEGKWLETPVPLAAALMLTELSFLLGLERTFVKILSTNLRAIAFNKNIGYEIIPKQENNYNQRYVLTKEKYFEKAQRFRMPYIKQHGAFFNIQIENVKDESEANIISIYSELSEENNELSEENANAYPVNLNKLNVNGKEYPSSYLKEMGRYMTPNRPTKDPLGGYGKLPWGVPPMAPRNILQSAERRIRHPDMKNKTRRGRHARQATRKNTRRNSRASRKIRMNRR